MIVIETTGLRRRNWSPEYVPPKRNIMAVLSTHNVGKNIEDLLYGIVKYADAITVLDICSTDESVSCIKSYMKDYDIPIVFHTINKYYDSYEPYRLLVYKYAIDHCKSLDWDLVYTDVIVQHLTHGYFEDIPIKELQKNRIGLVVTTHDSEMYGLTYDLNTDAYGISKYEPVSREYQ